MFRQAVEEESRDAKHLLERGNVPQAIEELTTLLQLDPANPELLLMRGVAYQKASQWENAIRDYRQLLKKNPNSEPTLYNLGMIYAFQLQEPEKALQSFDRFLSLKPHHPKAAKVAQIMVSLDPFPENGPTCAPCQEALGNALLKGGKPEEGYLHLMKARLFEVARNQH